MRSTMIKSALIAATLAVGAFATTSAFAFHPVGGFSGSRAGGFKGGFGSHVNQPRPGAPLGQHHHGGWSRLQVVYRGLEQTVIRPCWLVGYVDDDGNPAYRKVCNFRFR